MTDPTLKDLSLTDDAHELWTEQRIGEFWDHVATEPRFDRLYFSKLVAEPLTQMTRWFVDDVAKPSRSRPVVMDYGCGPGFLTRSLVDAGIATAAMEFSARSVAQVRERLASASADDFLGCTLATELPTPLETDAFDVVISTEAYEHLRDEWVAGYFAELARVCRPGGWVIVTTPFRESLDDNLCLCPNCHTTYHRWGHLRSVEPASMTRQATAAGLDVKWIGGVQLGALQPAGGATDVLRRWADTSAKEALRGASRFCRSLFQGVTGQPEWRRRLDAMPAGPHLIMVARPKPATADGDLQRLREPSRASSDSM